MLDLGFERCVDFSMNQYINKTIHIYLDSNFLEKMGSALGATRLFKK